MEKGRGKGTDTLQTDNIFTRKEYIERELVVMKIREWFWSAPGVHPKLDRDAAEDIMFSIPAADVAPVRHGRWAKVDDAVYYHMECSLCHERPLRNRWVNDNELSPYCPHCGALMNKDGDGDA